MKSNPQTTTDQKRLIKELLASDPQTTKFKWGIIEWTLVIALSAVILFGLYIIWEEASYVARI